MTALPRKRLALFGALSAIAGLSVIVLPLVGISFVGGFRLFEEGGLTMFWLLGASLVVGLALAVLGVLGVRGRRGPLGAMVVIPAAVPVLMILGVGLATTIMGDAVGGESIVPAERLRILAQGTAELDALYIYGALVSATAFGAAAIAVLGAASTADGAGRGWRATIIVGLAGVVVHLAWRGSVVAAAALLIVTALAGIASRDTATDDIDARGWLSAALCVVVGLVLFDFARMMLTERQGLLAIANEADTAQKLAVLRPLADARRAALFGMAVDAIVGFSIVAMGFLAERRRPLQLVSGLAIASTIFALGLLFVSRRQVTRLVEAGAHSSEDARAKLPLEPAGAYAHGDAPIVIIDLHPDPLPTTRSLSWFDRELGIYADGDMRWTRVMTAIAKEMKDRNKWFPHNTANTSPPDLSIRLQPHDAGIGFYAAFLAGTEPLLRIKLAYYGLDHGPDVVRDFPESTTLSDVVAEYTKRAAGRDALPAFTVELPKDF